MWESVSATRCCIQVCCCRRRSTGCATVCVSSKKSNEGEDAVHGGGEEGERRRETTGRGQKGADEGSPDESTHVHGGLLVGESEEKRGNYLPVPRPRRFEELGVCVFGPE